MKYQHRLPGGVAAAVLTATVVTAWLWALPPAASVAQEQKPANRWETAIARFEARDKQNPPPADGILFLGSSSIVLWDVAKSFPDLPVYNRGFGGSRIGDSVYFADRIVIPYKPKTIVFYAGENDVAGGMTPQQVLADYQALVKKVHAALPQTRIVFIQIKPSILRWKLIDKIRETNRLIREFSAKDQRLAFVEVEKPMLGADGKPRAEIFKKDGLHMNEEGYKIWNDLLRPYLKKPQ